MSSVTPKAGDKICYLPVANCPYIGIAAGDPQRSPDGMAVINITISVALTDVEKWPYRAAVDRAAPKKAA